MFGGGTGGGGGGGGDGTSDTCTPSYRQCTSIQSISSVHGGSHLKETFVSLLPSLNQQYIGTCQDHCWICVKAPAWLNEGSKDITRRLLFSSDD